jgi:hypothetical protein
MRSSILAEEPRFGCRTLDTASSRDPFPSVSAVVSVNPRLTLPVEPCVTLIAALLLDLSGKGRMTRLNLPRPAPLEMWAQLVRGKTIGLVGFGRIAVREFPFAGRCLGQHHHAARHVDTDRPRRLGGIRAGAHSDSDLGRACSGHGTRCAVRATPSCPTVTTKLFSIGVRPESRRWPSRNLTTSAPQRLPKSAHGPKQTLRIGAQANAR